MAEQHLDNADVGAGFEQMSSEAVAQRMNGDRLVARGRRTARRTRSVTELRNVMSFMLHYYFPFNTWCHFSKSTSAARDGGRPCSYSATPYNPASYLGATAHINPD
jgi:hypothetical protein